jgi:hypothetical protein
MSGAGESWDGYTRAGNVPGEDGKAVSGEFARCWPAGEPGIGAATKQAPGGAQQENRGLVYPGEGQGKKKRKPKKAP